MSEIQEEVLEGITITEKAAERLLQVRTDEDGDYLRASVSGGGCSGMNYDLAWDKELGEFDKIYEKHGIKVTVDLSPCFISRA